MHDGSGAGRPGATPNSEVFTPVRRPRGRPKVMSDEQQADIILANAETLFLEKGFSGTTMNDIAAACRMSKRTLYRLFPSKTEMFGEMIRRHRRAMVDVSAVPEDVPVREALRRIMCADLPEEEARTRVHLLRLVLMEAERTPEIAAIVADETARGTRSDLAAFLSARAAKGEIVIGDPDRWAEMLTDLVYGALSRRRADGFGWRDTEERRRNIETGIDVFLNGVVAR